MTPAYDERRLKALSLTRRSYPDRCSSQVCATAYDQPGIHLNGWSFLFYK